MQQDRWQFFPDIFLRKAGFPFDLLQELYSLQSVSIVKNLLEIEHEQIDIRNKVFTWVRTATEQLSSPSRYFVSRMQKALTQGHQFERIPPIDIPSEIIKFLYQWNQLAKKWQKLYNEGQGIFNREIQASRESLRQIAEQERFQEAIFLNSPNMYGKGLRQYLEGRGSPTKRRQAERTIMFYLQRFCAKNDTASFFGPLDYGRFQPEIPDAIQYRVVGGEYPPHRRVLLTYWAAETLALTMQQDPRLFTEMKPLRSALILLKREGIFVPSLHREFPLDSLSLAILSNADGTISIAEMSRLWNIPPDILVQQTQFLQSIELLQLRILLPLHPIDPLEALEDIVENFSPGQAKTDWEKILNQFRTDITAFEQGPLTSRIHLLSQLETLFVDVTKNEPQRGQGQSYSDRLLIYEDTSGDIQDFVVGGLLYETLFHQLQAGFDVFASFALKKQTMIQHTAWQQLQHIVQQLPASDSTWLINLYLQARQIEGKDLFTDVQTNFWEEAWEKLINDDKVHVVSLHDEDISPILVDKIKARQLLAAPDVMLAAGSQEAILRGDFKIILSELHSALIPALKALTLFHPTLSQSLEQARKLSEALTFPEIAGSFFARRVSKIDEWNLGRPKIHPLWFQKDTNAVDVAIAEVQVDLSQPEVGKFRSKSVPRPFFIRDPLFLEEPLPSFVYAFTRPEVWAVPILNEKQHTPRIEINNVVLQRERWSLEKSLFPQIEPPFDTFESFLALWRWKRQQQMPDQVFFRPDIADVKPVLADFLSPLSCMCLLYMMRSVSGGVFTEMLPGPDELWLHQDGKRYTSELRFTVFHTGDTFSLHNSVPSDIQTKHRVNTANIEPAPSQFRNEPLPGQTTYSELAEHLLSVQKQVQALISEY